MQILAVDPHVRHMAWAIINMDTEAVLSTGTIRAPKGMTQAECQDFWYGYCKNAAILGYTWPEGFAETVHLVIEIPDHLKSRSNKQLCDLVALSMCVATFCQGYTSVGLRSYDQVQPRTWKGRVSKAHTNAEVRAICGARVAKWTDHVIDAAAIGLWWCRRSKLSLFKVA